MSERSTMPSRIGLVVHPSRDIERTLEAIGTWAAQHGVELVQIPRGSGERKVAEPGDPADCDLIVAVGGDGTMLAAMHAAAGVDRPVLGVACGSLGVLMTVSARYTTASLDRYAAGDWTRRLLPAVEAVPDGGPPVVAFNDVAITRRGQAQVTSAAAVDAVLYARFVGDGFVVSTPIGSSAYTLAAGGPLMAPGAEGFALTPLAPHGGSVPPLVIGDGSVLRLDVTPGYGGIRLEVDGRLMEQEPRSLEVRLRAAVATLVGFEGQEPLLSGLRRRGLISDSPRVLARDKRDVV
jgi:NAD+ kinase